MKAIFRVNAAPGFEDSVEDALSEMEGVFGVVQEKVGNYDLVVAVEGEDANELQDLENAIRQESGIQGVKQVGSPDRDLLNRLRPD